ncbi:ricin-type beta-trefoil lectin domain protein [Actinoplanes sp. NPDC049316]|uniref:ricin-type beta-trefoil lectin domain protein n=1 Tax=Actinoplanes sp. NPDC049316 TaxID=3154727 RepID=UPI003423E9E3
MHLRAFRRLPLGLALAVAATFGVGQLPHLASPAVAASGDAADQAAAQLRQDECLLSNALRLGGPAAKQAALTGLDGTPAALHAAADPAYWNSTPLAKAYATDHAAQMAKLDQLKTFSSNLLKVNGTLSLGTLETPQAMPNGPANPWNAVSPHVTDPFKEIGLSTWVAQQYWTTEGSFYEDPTPLASADSVAALTALGNSRYHDPADTDPNFQQNLREYLAWQDMSFMHGYHADDTRIVLENGGFPRSAPAAGTVAFRVAVEQLKARFASCASKTPADPNRVLNAEVMQADQEWHAEIAGQKTQRSAIYTASMKTEAALAAGSEALGQVLIAAQQANLMTYWNAYWSPGGPGVVGTGPITFKLSGGTSLCLDNKGGTNANNNPIQAYACKAASTSQQWTPYTGTRLDGQLRNTATGKCLQAAGTTSGSKVVLYTCKGAANERWQYVTTKGVTRLYNVGAGLCLGFPTATSGQAATVRKCDAGTSQNFAVSQDNSTDGDKSPSYPKPADFTKVSQALTTVRSTANTQNQIIAQQAAIAGQQATVVTNAQNQAYAIADAAGAPRGRGLLSGQQEAQVVLASSAALTALAKAGTTAYQATSASVADSQTLAAAAQTQASASQAAFKLAAAQEADKQAKAAADGAAQQAKNAAAQADTAKQALATAQAAEARAKKDADVAHAKRLAAEAEAETAAEKKAEAAAHQADAAREKAAAQSAAQAAQNQLSRAQSAKTTAQQKAADAQKADQAATEACQRAWDAQARANALEAKAQAANAHADAESAKDDAGQARAAADRADAAADAAEADAAEAQKHADAATAAAKAADAAATQAEAAASRAQSDADAAAAAKADADAAVRAAEAAVATAIKAAQQASADAAAARQEAAKADADAKVAKKDADDSAVAAQQAQSQAAVTAGYAYTTSQAAAAATTAAQEVTKPANDAIQLGAPFVDHDSSAGLAVLSAQAAKSIAEQQQAAAQAKAAHAAHVAGDAQQLADTATGDAKAAAAVAADAAAQAARAAVSAQQALASAAEAEKYAAQAQASLAQTKAYDARATADSSAAQAAADKAGADALEARASADAAEQDAEAAQQAAAEARKAAEQARQAAKEADAAADAAEAAAEHAEAQAESAQQAALLALQQQNATSVDTGGATGVGGVYTTQEIEPIGNPVPLNPCNIPPGYRTCNVKFLIKFKLTVNFYLCDEPGAGDLQAGGCPADKSTFVGSMVQDTQAEVTKTLDAFDITLTVDKAFLKALWDGFSGDFVKCSHGSVSGCAWAASWFIPESAILDAVKAIKSLNLALHTGIGIADAWKVVDGLKLSPEIAAVIRAEVEADEAALAGCRLNSFPPDTPVRQADGSYRPAGAVRVGDQVMSIDPATGQRTASVVSATYAHDTDQSLPTLTLTGGGSLVTTPGHRIFVSGRGWRFASDVHVGDRLGGPTVVSISPTPGAGRRVVDFTVAGTHNFFVRAGAVDVLVHNCGDLGLDEAVEGAHTLRDHVNPTAEDAIAKAIAETAKQKDGRIVPTAVWTDQVTAQRAIDQAIVKYVTKYPKGLQTWFGKVGKGGSDKLTLQGSFGKGTSLGKIYYPDRTVERAGNTYTVVLKRVKGHDQGFVVYTAYPNPL